MIIIFIGYLVILFLITYSTQGLVNLKDTSPREKILDNVEQSSKKYNPVDVYIFSLL